jgi:ribosomal protein L37E
MFQNRKLLIATKHGKEKVIAPLLERELGVICFTDSRLDTDVLGTFTGEVERILDPFSAAREKCRLGAEISGSDLVLASEGSFGPHPSLYFISADQEILLLVDLKNKLEIFVAELSTSTNFSGREIHDEEELNAFAEQAGFPEHGLILRKSKDSMDDLHKGIRDSDTLFNVFGALFSQYGTVYVETDMRAMCNPTRLEVIKKATEKLLQKIASVCPDCGIPGFGITDAEKGLPCSQCGFPTQSVKAHIFTCGSCGFQKTHLYPNQKKVENPQYCHRCNP